MRIETLIYSFKTLDELKDFKDHKLDINATIDNISKIDGLYVMSVVKVNKDGNTKSESSN